MDVEVIIDKPWEHILRAVRREEGKTVAAIAYVTKRLLDMNRGDILVCDSSELSVKSSQTDPKVLLGYLRKGVSVLNHPGLHAKAIARGSVAVVGSANSSNASADEHLTELVTILRRRPAVAAIRERIEMIARRSVVLDPVTLTRLARLFNRERNFRPRRERAIRQRRQNKTRAWCIATYFRDENPEVEKTRLRGVPRARKAAQSLLGKYWRERYWIDDDLTWRRSDGGEFELGDQIFDVEEAKTLKPPGVLVHKESSNTRHGSVLFICRERKRRSRQMKNVRRQTDAKTFRLLRRAGMRQLSPEQLDRINQIFAV